MTDDTIHLDTDPCTPASDRRLTLALRAAQLRAAAAAPQDADTISGATATAPAARPGQTPDPPANPLYAPLTADQPPAGAPIPPQARRGSQDAP